MSDESTVTFVGGKAVSQDEGLESTLAPDERADAMAAVREAIQKAGEESAEDAKTAKAKDPFKPAGTSPDRGPDGKFVKSEPEGKDKPTSSEEAEQELDIEKASVKQLLKQREKVAALKKDAKDEISKERNSLKAEWQALQRGYQEIQELQAQLKRDREAIQALRTDPARAIREIGYDPERFILDLAQEGTPEGISARKQRELESQLAEIREWKQQQARAAEEARYQQQMQMVQSARQNAVETFVKMARAEDKYPHINAFFEGNDRGLVALGDLTAEEYRSLSGGREGSFEDILDYIEDDLATKATRWYTKTNSVKSQKVETAVEPPKSKGKTLNPEASGERRAMSQKELKDLDGEERHEAAKQAVAVALAASKRND